MAPASAATVDGNTWYVLVNRNSGKALDVYNFSTADGGSLVQWSRSNGNNQQWRFVDSGGGYYRVQSRHSGKVLDVANLSTADAADVVQWSDHNGTNQQFQLADSSGGYVRLINRNSGKAVEVQNASTADGGKIVQYSDWGGTNQQWQLVAVGSVSNPSPSPSQSPNPSPSASPSNGSWPPSSSYSNPVLWEDLADIDVFRVDDTYYYSASTMHYSPGAPILRSYDLVNWEYAGHSVPKLDFGSKYDLNGGRAYVNGVWASFLNYRKSNKTFYWGGCIDFSKTYIYTATSAEGPGTGTPRSTSATTTPDCSSTTTTPCTSPTATPTSASPSCRPTAQARSAASRCSPPPPAWAPWKDHGCTSATAPTTSSSPAPPTASTC
ncbi:hypothetical protein GCM10027612_42100 [Microbispora bryophytorum subsp. camponoti]